MREQGMTGREKLALLERLGWPALSKSHPVASYSGLVAGYVHLEALMMCWFDERVPYAEELLGEDFERLTRSMAGEIIEACVSCGCEDRLVGYLIVLRGMKSAGASKSDVEATLAALDAALARLVVFGDPPGEAGEGEDSRGDAEARRGEGN